MQRDHEHPTPTTSAPSSAQPPTSSPGSMGKVLASPWTLPVTAIDRVLGEAPLDHRQVAAQIELIWATRFSPQTPEQRSAAILSFIDVLRAYPGPIVVEACRRYRTTSRQPPTEDALVMLCDKITKDYREARRATSPQRLSETPPIKDVVPDDDRAAIVAAAMEKFPFLKKG